MKTVNSEAPLQLQKVIFENRGGNGNELNKGIRLNLTPFGRTLQIFNITKISTAETLQFRHTVFRPS
jgi:hypothetical protein